ncbi:MAG: hypothetical protein R6U89_05090 [Dehalococcoidia bacterium]
MELEIGDDLKMTMEERGLREEDVKKVIQEAESSGDKLYQPDTPHCLAKLKIEESWVFVEYSAMGDDKYRVNRAYSMKTEFGEE